MPAFMASLGSRDAAAARALEFTILTAARTGEMLGANPGEFDLDAGIWAVPAERMKIAKVHRVPLSARAVDIVTTAIGANGKFAFDGSNGKPLSSMAMAMLLRRMKVDYTVHGFRSAFSDWVAETTDYSSEVREASLSHTIENKAEAAYRRGDLFDKRRALMNDWAAFCAGASRGE